MVQIWRDTEYKGVRFVHYTGDKARKSDHIIAALPSAEEPVFGFNASYTTTPGWVEIASEELPTELEMEHKHPEDQYRLVVAKMERLLSIYHQKAA